MYYYTVLFSMHCHGVLLSLSLSCLSYSASPSYPLSLKISSYTCTCSLSLPLSSSLSPPPSLPLSPILAKFSGYMAGSYVSVPCTALVFLIELQDLADLVNSSVDGPVQDARDQQALHLLCVNVQLLQAGVCM